MYYLKKSRDSFNISCHLHRSPQDLEPRRPESDPDSKIQFTASPSPESDPDSKIQFSLEHAFGDFDFFPAGTFTARLKTWNHRVPPAPIHIAVAPHHRQSVTGLVNTEPPVPRRFSHPHHHCGLFESDDPEKDQIRAATLLSLGGHRRAFTVHLLFISANCLKKK